MWVWLLMCTVLLWLVLFRFKRRRMIKLASKLPTLKGDLPFLGVAHTLCGNSEAIMEQMKSYSYEAMQHDGLVSGWCGPFLFYGMVNPVDLEYVLKTCMDKSNFHKFSRNVVGNGGIFAPVSIWRRRRKVLVPTFSPKILETFVQVFSKKSQKLVEVLEKKVGRGPVSMWPYLSSYTFDSVCETALGVTVQALENPKTPFLEAMNRLLELVCLRTFHLWLHPDWIYRMLPQHRQHLYHLNVMHKFTDEVIENKRKEIDAAKKAETVQQEDLNSSDYKAKAFLDHMIQLSGDKGDGFTNIELREEVMTFALAGTDTSAVAVGFTLMLLAKYPHIQEKVYQELYEVFGDSDRPIVKEDLMKLKYLERVVKESLRLFPPVPIILRQVDNDVKLPSGRVLPAGGIVVILIWGVHRDPKYWGPDVEVFDPDRFLPERFTQTHACNFMPFSQGPRNCVGYQYAMMSIKTALSALLRKYKIVGEPETSPIPKIKVKLEMMMKAIDEYTVALERRKPVIDK